MGSGSAVVDELGETDRWVDSDDGVVVDDWTGLFSVAAVPAKG